jgi:hypothetical protein
MHILKTSYERRGHAMKRMAIIGIVLVIGMVLIGGCVQNYPPNGGDSSGGGGSQVQLDVNVWTDSNTYSQGQEVVLHWSVNKPANVTLYIDLPGGGRNTCFTNVLHDAGTYSYMGTAGPQGSRTAVIRAVDTSGQTDQDAVTYSVGGGVLVPGPE